MANDLHRRLLDPDTGVELIVLDGSPATVGLTAPKASLALDRAGGAAYLSLGAGSWTAFGLGAPAWSSITGTPTTIAGYGITDAYTKTAADARYGQLVTGNAWTGIQTLSVGGLAIQLTNGTSNAIYFSTGGVAAPTTTTRSVGTKLVLYPSLSGTQVDFGIGMSSNTMWFSLPDNSATEFFAFYGATTQVASLSGTGVFTATSLVGPLATAAQPNITSLGTLTGLTVNNSAALVSSNMGTGSAYIRLTNTGGDAYIGLENSANTAFAAGAYNFTIYVASGTALVIDHTTRAGTYNGTFVVTGALTGTGTVAVTHATSAAMVLNTTTGATTDNTGILFERGGAIKWRIGTNIGGANADVWSLYNNTLGDAITANFSTGLVTLIFGATVGSTNGVQLSSTNAAQIVLGELTGATPNQLIIGMDSGTTFSRIQSVHQGVGYTQLDINPLGGLVTVGAGLTFKTSATLQLNSGLTGGGIRLYGQSDNFIYMTGGTSSTAAGIALWLNNYTTIVGYFYGSAGFIGFLDSSGNWRVQASSTGGSLLGAWTLTGAVILNSSLNVTGAVSLASTLSVTGALTLSGDVNTNGTFYQKKGTATSFEVPVVVVSTSAAPGSASGYPAGTEWIQVTAPV